MATSSSASNLKNPDEPIETKNSGTFRETSLSPKRFYGLAEHRSSGGVFSSLLKRKIKKVTLPSDVKTVCQQLEDYKTCSDRLHQSMMFLLIENTLYSMKLDTIEVPAKIDMERPYLTAADYLQIFDEIQKKGRKGQQYDNLEPTIAVLKKLGNEYEKYVRKQIEVARPLAKFIGDDYWEYAKLRRIHWESMEAYDMALTAHNKERTEETEKETINAQNIRNDCKAKLLEFINRINVEEKPKHADCIIRFGKEAGSFHTAMSEHLAGFDDGPRSAMSKPKTKISGPSKTLEKSGPL